MQYAWYNMVYELEYYFILGMYIRPSTYANKVTMWYMIVMNGENGFFVYIFYVLLQICFEWLVVQLKMSNI